MRDKLFKWVKKYYEATMPEVELCIGVDHNVPFNKSRAINNAAKKATRDIFVIADIDAIYDPNTLIRAIKMLNKYSWVIPYNHWLDLTKTSTEKLLVFPPQWPLPLKVQYRERIFKRVLIRRKNRRKRVVRSSKPFGGVIVVPRKNFYRVKGFDERFVGWGREDNAFRDAMNTICGHYGRLRTSSVYHLWHPRVGARRNPNFRNNARLYKRYAKRRGKAAAMKRLINERGH